MQRLRKGDEVIVITGYAEAAMSDGLETRDGVTLLEKSCSGDEMWETIRRALKIAPVPDPETIVNEQF